MFQPDGTLNHQHSETHDPFFFQPSGYLKTNLMKLCHFIPTFIFQVFVSKISVVLWYSQSTLPANILAGLLEKETNKP